MAVFWMPPTASWAREPVVLVDSWTDTTDRSGSYTSPTLNFGDDFSNRTLVAVAHLVAGANNPINQTACTIGGASASGDDAGDFGGSGTPVGAAGTGVWAAKPSGTSGIVVLSFASTANACAIYLYAVMDLASATPSASSVGDGAAGGITSDPNYSATPSGTINIPSASNGAALFGGVTRAGSTGAITLSGITQLYDLTLDGSHRIAGGFDSRLPQQTNRPIGFSTGSSNIIFAMRASSFA